MAQSYIKRVVDEVLDKRLSLFGAVLVQGPKWCGKTTTSRRHCASSLFLMDPAGDFAARRLAELDPSQAIAGTNPRLIDEWQEVPKLWDAVRFECDRCAEPGLFVLTGSATPRDADASMHSGVGRFSRVRMHTMTLLETGVSNGSASLTAMLEGSAKVTGGGAFSGLADVAELVCRGGWPQAVGLETSDAMDVALAYVDGVSESDASRVDGTRRDPVLVRALMASLARNESTLASMKAIGAGMVRSASVSTLRRYMGALVRIGVIEDVPAWNPALRSPVRLRATAKHHLCDSSLAVASLGVSPSSLVADPKTLGLLFESLVIHDLIVYADVRGWSVAHYHDDSGLEADAIVSARDGAWAAFEVKLGAAQVDNAADNLLRLEKKMVEKGERPPAAKCVVVGFGTPAHTRDDGVLVVPIDTLGL